MQEKVERKEKDDICKIYTTLTHPVESAWRFQIWYAHPISLDCHQLYNFARLPPTVHSNLSERLCSRSTFLRSFAVSRSLSNVVRFSPCTILPNFIDRSAETALYSSFGGHNGGVGRKGEKRKRTSGNFIASIHNQKGPCVQPQPFATITT